MKSAGYFENALDELQKYIEKEQFKGYDPYDTLNSPFKFKIFGKFAAVLAIQFQKRNPFNIRPLLGIKKDYNPKALGLLLYGYCSLQLKRKDKDYSSQINFLFNYLKNNYSKGYSGYCWGYNFDWASSGKYIKAFSPNVVVTAFVAKGIFKYYELTKDAEALNMLESICNFILKDLPKTETAEGICFGYTTLEADCCYNASLLAATVLSQQYSLNQNKTHFEYAKRAVDYVVNKQHPDGHWNYSVDPKTGVERKQIDFHQGYVIDAISDFMNFCKVNDSKYSEAIRRGTEFYKKEQFFEDGRSKWRLPKEYPVEIHNQSQGIITFCKTADFTAEHLNLAQTIAKWTITNMQDKRGFFYYKKFKNYTHRTSYMRWSQAWMFVALVELINTEESNK